ncbi:hypothetical protein ACHAWF_014970 [Thalassiosira exigua]
MGTRGAKRRPSAKARPTELVLRTRGKIGEVPASRWGVRGADVLGVVRVADERRPRPLPLPRRVRGVLLPPPGESRSHHATSGSSPYAASRTNQQRTAVPDRRSSTSTPPEGGLRVRRTSCGSSRSSSRNCARFFPRVQWSSTLPRRGSVMR